MTHPFRRQVHPTRTSSTDPRDGSSPMRITFVLPLFSPVPIGGFRVVFEHANHLARRGCSVTIVFPRRLKPEPVTASRLLRDLRWWIRRRTSRPPLDWHMFDANVDLLFVPDLTRLPRLASDAVVATSWETAEPVYRLPADEGRKHYLVQHYETWTGSKATVDATLLMPMRLVVIAKWLEDIAVDLGAQDVRRITNGLDLSRFRVMRSIDSRPMKIVSMNHAEAFKGVPDALAALRSFNITNPAVEVVMFGTMPRTSNIPEWVEYFENPSQDVLARDIYNDASVYLGASTVEGWGLPPAEAMACGCVFVGTDIGGFAEFAVHGKNALLSEPGDPAALAANLQRLASDPDLRVRMQHEAVESMSCFTWDRAGDALLAALTDDVRTTSSRTAP